MWESPEDRYTRDEIVDELVGDCLRVGMSLFEVVRLLGEPCDPSAKRGFLTIQGILERPKARSLVYDAGNVRSLFLDGTGYLYLTFDERWQLTGSLVVRHPD